MNESIKTPPPQPPDVEAEITRRHGHAVQIEAFFRAHPKEWIDANDLMALGGAMAWRTRISDARKVFKAEGGVLENRQLRVNRVERDETQLPARMFLSPVISEYRYLPYEPLGRDAGHPPTAGQLEMFR